MDITNSNNVKCRSKGNFRRTNCLVLTNHLNQLLDYLLVEKRLSRSKNNIAFEGTHVVQIKIPNQNLYIFESGSHKADKELYDKLELEYEGKR